MPERTEASCMRAVSLRHMSRLEIIDILRHDIFDSISKMVIEMYRVEVPLFPTLSGEEAIVALYDFICELEEERGGELPEKQINAFINFAKGMIFSIEAEMLSEIRARELAQKITDEMGLKTRFKNAFAKYIPEPFSQALRSP